MKNLLTKSDYLLFLKCPKALWLKKNKPTVFDEYKKPLSGYEQEIINQGERVEKEANKLFVDSIAIPLFSPTEKTQEALEQNVKFILQGSFEIDKLFIRTDVIEKTKEGINLYEIKSTSGVKEGKDEFDHIKDLAFQVYVLEKAGHKVKKKFVVTLNSKYEKNGELDLQNLFKTHDVTEKVDDIKSKVESDIKNMVSLVETKEINKTYCNCIYKTRSNHCEVYNYFNKKLTSDSIYNFNRIRKEKIIALLNKGINKIKDCNSLELKLNQFQVNQVLAQNETYIDKKEINNIFNNFSFPLYFLDYEAINFAIPVLDKTKPFEPVPFQFSLHILNMDGKLFHKEYLADDLKHPAEFAQKLMEYIRNIKKEGTVIVWNKAYENGINKSIAKRFPEYVDFMDSLITKTFDLQDIFKNFYIDQKFDGYTSIKKIHPILAPDSSSYSNLSVADGCDAMNAFISIINNKEIDNKKIKEDLLKYCELDTMAMVDIYKKIKEISN